MRPAAIIIIVLLAIAAALALSGCAFIGGLRQSTGYYQSQNDDR